MSRGQPHRSVTPVDDTQRLLEGVLDDDAQAAAPDHLLEDVFARTRTTRQSWRRPWDGARLPTIRGGATPLVVITVALIGLVAITTGAGSRIVAPSPVEAS